MRKQTKEIKVDYLRVFEEITNSKGEIVSNNPYNLSSILVECMAIPVKERNMQYKGEVIRLQEVTKVDITYDRLVDCKNLYKINFIRMKTGSISPIASSDGEYDENLLNETLKDDQYLADGTACLYDADKSLFIIARNRDGVLPSGILEFIRKVSTNKNLSLAIIPNDVNVKTEQSYIYRSLIMGISNVNEINKKDKKFFEERIPSVFSAINSFEGYGYQNIRIELSMGKSPKRNGLNNSMVKGTALNLMESGIENLNRLEISSKEDEQTSVEVVDLLNNKIKDSFKISYSRKQPILYNDIIMKLLGSYNKKKDIIYDII